MNLLQITDLYGYNNWAGDKILAFLDGLEPAVFTRDLGNSFPSLRDTLVHILSAEELWLSRWLGEAGREMLNPADFPAVAAVQEGWTEHDRMLQKFISSLSDTELQKVVAFKNLKGIPYSLELWKQMQHVVNHSSFHRGQIITMARQLGLQPPSMDLIYYYLGEK